MVAGWILTPIWPISQKTAGPRQFWNISKAPRLCVPLSQLLLTQRRRDSWPVWLTTSENTSAAFQRRLHGGPKVDHASAGAFECLKAQQLAVAFAISGHHGGLPRRRRPGRRRWRRHLWGRINRASQGRLEDYHAWQSEFSLPHANTPAFAGTRLEGMFFTRMLFSCLVDADYTDTGAFMDNSPYLPASSSLYGGIVAPPGNLCLRLVSPKGALNMQTMCDFGTVHVGGGHSMDQASSR